MRSCKYNHNHLKLVHSDQLDCVQRHTVEVVTSQSKADRLDRSTDDSRVVGIGTVSRAEFAISLPHSSILIFSMTIRIAHSITMR
jgi:hypothetical protein